MRTSNEQETAESEQYLKERISITIDSELLDWIDGMARKKTFASRSHGIEYCVSRTRDRLEKGSSPLQE